MDRGERDDVMVWPATGGSIAHHFLSSSKKAKPEKAKKIKERSSKEGHGESFEKKMDQSNVVVLSTVHIMLMDSWLCC